jgi:hypothetical protein
MKNYHTAGRDESGKGYTYYLYQYYYRVENKNAKAQENKLILKKYKMKYYIYLAPS